MATPDAGMGAPGLITRSIARESVIRIVRLANATAEFQRRWDDPLFRDLPGKRTPPGSSTRHPGPVLRIPAVGVVLTSRGKPARVRNAALALPQPRMPTMETGRVLPTMGTVLYPAS